MARNTDPVFALKPLLAHCTVSEANANLDGTGTIVTLYTVPVGGAKITKIWYKAKVTTTAGMIRLFVTDSAGANIRLFEEIAVLAITPSATVASGSNYVTYADFQLDEGQILSVSTEKAEAINVFAMIGEFENV
jgi:hypothetical protein